MAGHAKKVWMLVRGPGLAASMSKYLIDRISATGNIEVLTRTEIVDVTGTTQTGVEAVCWRNRDTGKEEKRPIRNVFLFLGADPTTDWVRECGVTLDDKGFIRTGSDSGAAEVHSAEERAARDRRLPLETSVAGVFAIGDVRSGSVKRVGGAIGEGAAVVAQIHAFIAQKNPR
jgi:thioredoxin reductase (NADPH)